MQIAYIGLGANLPSPAGTPEATLAAAVCRLQQLGRVTARSSLYSTEPVGYSHQPRFVNAVVALETELPARDVLLHLLQIEREFGRDRSSGVPNGPRTLDLDLLLYGQEVIHEPELILPHPRLSERAFVLIPLAEIAADLVLPGHTSVGESLYALRRQSPAQIHEIFALQSSDWHAGRPVPGDPASCGAEISHPPGGG